MLPVIRQQLSRFCIIAENFALSALREATSVSNCTFASREIRYRPSSSTKIKDFGVPVIYVAINNYTYKINKQFEIRLSAAANYSS